MIDIHHHCLPGIDDGPGSMEEAVALCRAAVADGIETIIATPHVHRGLWAPVSTEAIRQTLQHLRDAVGDHPRILPGSEYYFAHDMRERLQDGSIIPLAGGRYVLIELAANAVPPFFERAMHAVQMDGWVPVIAHPERNLVFQQHPELLGSLVLAGVRTQLTAGSLTGAFGPRAAAASEEFLQRGLVHFVATDAHNLAKRPPLLRAARARLDELVGPHAAAALTELNPRALLANHPLPFDPDPVEPAATPLLTRLRRVFTFRRA